MDSITMGINPPTLDIVLLYAELRRAGRVGEIEIPCASPCDVRAASVLVVVYKRAGVASSPIPHHQSMQPRHSQRRSGSTG